MNAETALLATAVVVIPGAAASLALFPDRDLGLPDTAGLGVGVRLCARRTRRHRPGPRGNARARLVPGRLRRRLRGRLGARRLARGMAVGPPLAAGAARMARGRRRGGTGGVRRLPLEPLPVHAVRGVDPVPLLGRRPRARPGARHPGADVAVGDALSDDGEQGGLQRLRGRTEPDPANELAAGHRGAHMARRRRALPGPVGGRRPARAAVDGAASAAAAPGRPRRLAARERHVAGHRPLPRRELRPAGGADRLRAGRLQLETRSEGAARRRRGTARAWPPSSI